MPAGRQPSARRIRACRWPEPRRLTQRAGPRFSEDGAVSDDPWQAQLEELGRLLRAQRAAAGLSLRDLAERTGVSNAYLSQLERGLHEPSLRVLRAVTAALGMPLGELLARAGILEAGADAHAPGVRETEAAIQRDPELSEPQRFALLSVYRSFMPTRR
jgi:transcriptional regulator with XRE-family HTH domain